MVIRTRAGRTGPRRSSATPVLAEAGTGVVATRAGRAVRAAATADSGGRGMVGTPARAARPRADAWFSARRPPGPETSSIVRIWRPLERNGPVERRDLTPRRPRHHEGRWGSDVTGGAASAYHSWRSRWSRGSDGIRRVARRRMADVAKNEPPSPGTPDIDLTCGTLGHDRRENDA